MKRIDDYKILSNGDPDTLATEVMEHLERGYVIYGKPFASGEYGKLHQTMVKPRPYDPAKDPRRNGAPRGPLMDMGEELGLGEDD